MNNDLPFDENMMLDDDFRQLIPIKIHDIQSEIVNLSIKFSTSWRHFISFSLMENMQVLPEETEFAKFLLEMDFYWTY